MLGCIGTLEYWAFTSQEVQITSAAPSLCQSIRSSQLDLLLGDRRNFMVSLSAYVILPSCVIHHSDSSMGKIYLENGSQK